MTPITKKSVRVEVRQCVNFVLFFDSGSVSGQRSEPFMGQSIRNDGIHQGAVLHRRLLSEPDNLGASVPQLRQSTATTKGTTQQLCNEVLRLLSICVLLLLPVK